MIWFLLEKQSFSERLATHIMCYKGKKKSDSIRAWLLLYFGCLAGMFKRYFLTGRFNNLTCVQLFWVKNIILGEISSRAKEKKNMLISIRNFAFCFNALPSSRVLKMIFFFMKNRAFRREETSIHVDKGEKKWFDEG